MQKGSFNIVYKIGNIILKIKKYEDNFSKLIIKNMDNKRYKKYQKDLNKIGIKTSKIYLNVGNILFVEKYIKGNTLQQTIESESVSIAKKISLLKKFLKLYKYTLNSNICIDCNMKNFIINKNDIYYIDFVPSLYKDKIDKVNNKYLSDYKLLYLDTKLQLLSIVNYVLKSMFYLNLEELMEFRNNLIKYIEKNFKLSLKINYQNEYSRKYELINKYIDGYINQDEFYKEYKKISKR